MAEKQEQQSEELMPMPFASISKRTLEKVQRLRRADEFGNGPENNSQFQIDQEMLDALRLDFQPIPPKEQAKYDELWQALGSGFLWTYGRYLSGEQIDYFLTSPLIIENGGITFLFRNWESANYHSDDKDHSLNGLVYYNYEVLRTDEKWSSDQKDDEAFISNHFGSGNLVVLKQIKDFYQPSIRNLDLDYLTTADRVAENCSLLVKELKKRHEWAFFDRTIELAQILLHDKIHTLQYKSPLPIRESATDYYVEQVFRKIGLPYCEDHFLRGLPAKLYWSLVVLPELDEMGLKEDLSFYMFGNLKGKKRQIKIKNKLCERFTPGILKEIFPKYKWLTYPAICLG